MSVVAFLIVILLLLVSLSVLAILAVGTVFTAKDTANRIKNDVGNKEDKNAHNN